MNNLINDGTAVFNINNTADPVESTGESTDNGEGTLCEHINDAPINYLSLVRVTGKNEPLLRPGSILSEAIEVFRLNGIPDLHLKAAATSMIAMLSAQLSDPLALGISEDDDAIAQKMLNTLIKIVPSKAVIEFFNMDTKALLYGGEKFKGKAVVGFDVQGFKKNLPALELLVSRGLLVDNLSFKNKETRGIEQMQTEGPTAFITIVKDQDREVLAMPYILHVHLSTSQELRLQQMIHMSNVKTNQEDRDHKIKSALLTKQLQRVAPTPVKVSFSLMIAQSLDLGVQNIEVFFELFMRVLKNITRINNGTQITQREILGEFFNVSSDLISEQCSPVYQNCLPGTQAQHVPQENADYLRATKVDYYYCWLLLKDLVRSGSESLTDRQIIVYEAISNYNFG